MTERRQPKLTQLLETENPDWSRWSRYVWLDDDIKLTVVVNKGTAALVEEPKPK